MSHARRARKPFRKFRRKMEVYKQNGTMAEIKNDTMFVVRTTFGVILFFAITLGLAHALLN